MSEPKEHFGNFPDHCVKGCPIRAVHQRMLEAHRHWHDAQKTYNDPDLFRVGVNACIQALRNVTFVLQKQKSHIPDFDTWYAGWQTNMRNDKTMRWLVDARNLIVKEGDLRTSSVAQVTVVDSYFERKPHLFPTPADPLIPTELIVAAIMASKPPEFSSDGYLRVERRWVLDEVPSLELLEAMAYCYERLSQLLADLHYHLSISVREDEASGPRCMLIMDDDRTVIVDLKGGHILHLRTQRSTVDREAAQLARDRYALDKVDSLDFKMLSLKDIAHGLFQNAKIIMEKDGYHVMMAWLRTSDATPHLMVFAPNDRTEKYLIAREIAREVKHYHADMVFVISESWVAKFDLKFPNRYPSNSPEREEYLWVSAISKSGEIIDLTGRITRPNKATKIGPISESTDNTGFFFDPVREVWQLKRGKDASPKT